MKGDSPYCNCLYFSSAAFARALTRLADEAFAVTGMSPSHGFILMTVANDPGIAIGDVARVMHLTPSTVTRLVEKLEHRQLVARSTEGKFTHVFPTEQGKTHSALVARAWAALYERYSALLGREEGDVLSARLTGALHRLENEH